MTRLSTHVLDAARGTPAAGVAVTLDGPGGRVAAAATDADGRVGGDWAGELPPGTYRLVFDTAGYLGEEAFFPEVVLTVLVTGRESRLHVPLLLSPFAYSTYRGS